MFRWLNGPGQAFKNPLPDSTNYLNAYNAAGKLIRSMTTPKRRDKTNKKLDEEGMEDDNDEVMRDKSERKPRSTKLVDELKAAKSKDAPGLPKESNVDLMPFPMNSQFRSHRILSDELRDEVYKRIAVDQKSVRDVSAALGVEMKRVAAVVRLKTIEKQWEQEVCAISAQRTPSFARCTMKI